MARPPNADPDATRGRIRDAAVKLFAVNGHAGTGLREIAVEAGVSLSLVNHYFGGKDELYRLVLASTIDELTKLGDRFTRELGAATDVRDTIARATRISFRFAREHRQAVLLMQRSILESGAIDPTVEQRSVLPFLEKSSLALSVLTGRTPESLRLPIQSAVFLVVRYSIANKRDLAKLVGVPSRGAELDPVQAVEDHLVSVILDLLLPLRV